MKDLLEQASAYHIDFNSSDWGLTPDPDGQHMVHEFTGKILHQTDTETKTKTTTAGLVRAERVAIGAAHEERFPVRDVFDSSGELFDFYEHLVDTDTGWLREDLRLDQIGDLLVVHQIKILPKHRGMKLGLLAMLRTIEVLGGGCAAAAIKPFPLQFCGKVNDKNREEFLSAQEKLCGYWRQLGFDQVDDSEYYILDLAYRRPTPEEVLGVAELAERT